MKKIAKQQVAQLEIQLIIITIVILIIKELIMYREDRIEIIITFIRVIQLH